MEEGQTERADMRALVGEPVMAAAATTVAAMAKAVRVVAAAGMAHK